MASDNEACCESDPNFAVICGFLKKFGVTCGLANIDFLDLQNMLENSQEVPQQLVDLHVKLLRKARKSVSSERWERAIIKLCHTFCSQDAWEIERFGYKKARISSKLRILKELLEMQFDYNSKFKNEINKLSAEELRTQPLGRDQLGCVYWFQSDNSCQIRVYKDDPDEETWALVAKDREGLLGLITHLNDGQEVLVNEDSSSLESEKPVVDTGQTDSNSSKVDESDSNNVIKEKSDDNDNEVPVIKPEVIRKEDIKEEEDTTIMEPVNNVKLDEPLEEECKIENSIKNVEENNKPILLPSTSPKPGSNIRIKPICELISSTNIDGNKLEITGVKEKYIRSDSMSSSVHHRKAVDSAGFDVHTNYLKRPLHDIEDIDEPSYIKHPRLDRPSLLSNKKRKSYSDEDIDEEEDEDDEVSDEIVEPLMLVKGKGMGTENEESNFKTSQIIDNSPIIGETIEESVLYFYGEGSGKECETGNDNRIEREDEVESSKTLQNSEKDSSSNLNDKECGHDVRTNNLIACVNVNKQLDTSDELLESHSSNRMHELSIEIPQTSNSVNEAENNESPKKSMFFFGPGCLQVKPSISPIKFNMMETLDKHESEILSQQEGPECKTVMKRRKSEKPMKKILDNINEFRDKNKELDEKHVSVRKKSEIYTVNNEVLPNNTIPASHHVPKNSISVCDQNIEDNDKLCEVPVIKKLESEVTGLPFFKSVSTVDKPKSKLENIVEKINQVKNIQKTDIDLGIKFKESLPDVTRKSDSTVTSLINNKTKNEILEDTKENSITNLKVESIQSALVNTKNAHVSKASPENLYESEINVEALNLSVTQLDNKTNPADHSTETTISNESGASKRKNKIDFQPKNCVVEELINTASDESAANTSKLLTRSNSSVLNIEEKYLKDDVAEQKESVKNRIFSSIDKSLNDAKCLERDKSDINKKLNSLEDVTDLNHSNEAAVSNSDKFNTNSISLIEMLSTSMKVPSKESKVSIDDSSNSPLQESAQCEIDSMNKKSVTLKKKSSKETKSIKNKLINEKQLKDKLSGAEEEEAVEENVITRRVTRRTRSNADKIFEPEIIIPKKKEPIKTVNITNKIEYVQISNPQVCIQRLNPHHLTKPDEKLQKVEPSPPKEQLEKKIKIMDASLELLATNRELRERKYNIDKNKNIPNIQPKKSKTKPVIQTKPMPKPNNNKSKAKGNKQKQKNEKVLKLRNSRNVTRSQVSAKVVDLQQIEEQIVSTEIQSSGQKSNKLMDVPDVKKLEADIIPDEETDKSNDSKESEKADETKDITNTENSEKPVDEPECIQKFVPLLTSEDITPKPQEDEQTPKSQEDEQTQKSQEDEQTQKSQEAEQTPKQQDEQTSVSQEDKIPKSEEDDKPETLVIDILDNNSNDVSIAQDSDPLVCSEDELKNPEPPMTLSNFTLDIEDEIAPVRITRKRAAQQSIDALRETRNSEIKVDLDKKGEDTKRSKLKRKRSVDRNFRRSIEEKKSKEISSSEDDNFELSVRNENQTTKNNSKQPKEIEKRRTSTRSTRTSDSPIPSSDAPSETSRTDASNTPPVIKQKKPRQIRKTLLGLEISQETEQILNSDAPMGVRQSRRIAQLKIKEEAERRKLEEVALQELKDEQKKRKGKKDEDKDYKSEKKRRSKHLPTEDETTGDAESEEKKKRKRKRKRRDPGKQFDVHNPWKSSSGSSSSEADEEEEEEDEIEDDDHEVIFKSDHEFSPESDLEEGGEVQPLKRARTARKESDPEEEVDDCVCQKCGQKDHPEWILLCDNCDCGWHCSCLRPPLLVIPEGDWFCPPCQHKSLVKSLQTELLEFDKRVNKKVMEIRRKERLAYVGISLDNVLPAKEPDEHRNRHRLHNPVIVNNNDSEDESDSEDSGSDSETSSSSASDSEPIYQLRERRQGHSYRFNDYDDLINSAIQDELDAVKGAGNQGRGKDISTIVNAEKQNIADDLKNEIVPEGDIPNILTTEVPSIDIENVAVASDSLPPVVPLDYDKKPIVESDEEPIHPVRKVFSKKKHRKLNSLDVNSDDDAESDEDFKGSSSSDSEEDFEEDEYAGSESSDDLDTKRGKRRKDFGPVRRSTRARISRYDKDFINDDTDSEETSRRKKNRSFWDESESEESDRSWGRRKRRKLKRRTSNKPKKLKKKKKKRSGGCYFPERSRKKSNIKFGGLNDDEEIGRRTRGKKINYLEALGSDSEDELRRKPPKIEESEDEYIVQEDEAFKQQLENDDKDSDESGVENILKDLPLTANPKPKSRGRGKAGLKIPRKPKDPSAELFPPLITDLLVPPNLQNPPIIPMEPPLLQTAPLLTQPLLLEQSSIQQQELQDIEEEPNPIEQINKNIEQMNEQEMEKMMEEEDYANKQLQLVALQIEKEKKRKEREAKKLESLMQQTEQKIPKKRGRKPKNQMLGVVPDLVPPFTNSSSILGNNAELSEPPGVSLPMFSEIAPVLNADGTPKKRRGRGKGKKTLAAEAAAIAAAAAANKDNIDMEMGLEGPASSSSNTVSPAPDSPMHGSKLGIAAPPQPFSQSQPTPSVITRMLQSQPGQGAFPGGGSKYFGPPSGDPQLGLPPGSGPYHPGAVGPRGLLPGPYQQQGLSHYPVIRSGPPPPHRLHSPGPPGLPPMYHPHRSLDPSPSSGGGSLNISTANRDRQSPAVVSPASNSPLSKGDPTPPPPPYTRPQVGHFPPVTPINVSSIPITGRQLSMIPSHLQPPRGSSMSPYHPGVPPNYHYGAYPPPPPLTSDDGGQPPPNYPGSTYPEPYHESGAQMHPPEGGNKSFDEEGGEFVGLVSYFSSQREDDLDT